MEKEKSRTVYKVDNIKDFRELINKTTERYPNNIAYKYKIKNNQEVVYVNKTYAEFKKDVEALSTKLLDMGLSGKKVAVIGNNRYEWCTTYLAVTTGGMIIVPLDRALPDNEIISLLKRSKAEAIVCEEKYIDSILSLKDTGLKYIISMENTTNENALCYNDLILQGEKLLENGNTLYENVVIDPKAVSILLFTSGTTSLSKGVLLSQENICSDIMGLAEYLKLYPSDTLLSFLPIHHTFECTVTFLFGLYHGVTVAFCDGLKYIQQNMNEYQVSVFVAVPLILENVYKKIWKGIEEQGKKEVMEKMISLTKKLCKMKIDLRRKVFKSIIDLLGGKLRIVLIGSAPLDKKVIIGFNDFGIDLIQGYGLTETSPVISAETDKEKNPGSIGLPLPNLEVEIANPNEEGIGEIIVKGPTVMLGYYENKDATDKCMKDGWFYTGDYGYLDNDGFLFICGRKNDVIVLKNGKNIYPQELEILLNQIPIIQESMVFARNKDARDTTLCAKIVYNEEVFKNLYGEKSEDEKKEIIWKEVKEINKNLPIVKHIKEINITSIPLAKTTTQKVKRYQEIKNCN